MDFEHLENSVFINVGFEFEVDNIKRLHKEYRLHTIIIICETEAYIENCLDVLYSLLIFTLPRSIKVYYVHSSIDRLVNTDLGFKDLVDTGGLEEICWPTAHIGPCMNGYEGTLDLNDYLLNVDEVLSDSKLYLSCTHRDKPHRYIMNDMLKKHNLIDDGIITWGQLGHLKNKDIGEYQCKYWYPDIRQVDFQFEYKIPNEHEDLLFPLEVKDGTGTFGRYNSIQKRLKGKYFIEIITESEHTFNRLTEKTFKAILYQSPFIVLSCRNFHKELENLGFELYDEIFDYTFDDLPYTKMTTKAEMICQNLQRLKNQDYRKLQRTILPKLVRNKERLLGIYNNKEYLDETFLSFLKNNTPSFYEDYIKNRTVNDALINTYFQNVYLTNGSIFI